MLKYIVKYMDNYPDDEYDPYSRLVPFSKRFNTLEEAATFLWDKHHNTEEFIRLSDIEIEEVRALNGEEEFKAVAMFKEFKDIYSKRLKEQELKKEGEKIQTEYELYLALKVKYE